MGVEWTDRYTALGIPYPDPRTICVGACEGTGWIPVYRSQGDRRTGALLCGGREEENGRLILLWQQAESEKQTTDGWHFVKCPDCDGTGKKP